MGSTPIPGSKAEPPYSIPSFLWDLKKEGLKESTIKENYAKILKNLEKNLSYSSKMSELPPHRKQRTLSVLWSKTRSTDGIVFISAFLIPVFIFFAGIYGFNYTPKEMFPPTVTAFTALIVGFVIRKRK
jgi:hypothetical protein